MANQSDLLVHECDSWTDFIQLVRPSRNVASRIFRGHRDPSWKLSSQLERFFARYKGDHPEPSYRKLFSPNAPAKYRDNYLRAFKHYAWQSALLDFGEDDLSSDEWWALARHHGLVTPLLDWTSSPYVAAYFAFAELPRLALESNREKARALAKKMNLPKIPKLGGVSPTELGKITIWELYFHDTLEKKGELELLDPRPPGAVAVRQRNQLGLFTRLTHDVHLDLESYLRDTENLAYLTRYNIKGSEYVIALTDLKLMGISRATLFPDLDGAAWQANWDCEMAQYTQVWRFD